jgi:hypothetical protein
VEIAVGEEYRPRTVSACERRFFPEVRPIAGNNNLFTDVALASLASQSIDPAAAWTQGTGFHYLPGFL